MKGRSGSVGRIPALVWVAMLSAIAAGPVFAGGAAEGAGASGKSTDAVGASGGGARLSQSLTDSSRGVGFALIELFTSEGCSSCPPADDALSSYMKQFATRSLPVYALAWHVDYWDSLGWKDPYDSAYATARQRAYAEALPSTVYTPQLIVNGIDVAAYAGNEHEIAALVTRDLKRAAATSVTLTATAAQSARSVAFHAEAQGLPSGSVLDIAIVESDLIGRPDAGENAGQRLDHSNVVRWFKSFRAADVQDTIAIPENIDVTKSEMIAFVQDAKSMVITGATGVDLSRLAVSGSVRGALVDAHGQGVGAAVVQACGVTVCIPAATAADGSFVMDGVPPGLYELKAGLNVSAGAAGAAAGNDDAGRASQAVDLGTTVDVGAGEEISLEAITVGA